MATKRKAPHQARAAKAANYYAMLPTYVLRSRSYLELRSHVAQNVLLHAASLYRKRPSSKRGNNGALPLPVRELEVVGYGEERQIRRALDALIAAGLLIRTRQHNPHQPALYALGWLSIDEVRNGKTGAPLFDYERAKQQQEALPWARFRNTQP